MGMNMAATPPTTNTSNPMSGLMSLSANSSISPTSMEPITSSTIQKNGLIRMSAIFSAGGRMRVSGMNSVLKVNSPGSTSSQCFVRMATA